MSDLRRVGLAWIVALAGLWGGSAFAATCTVTDSSDYNPITESVITGTLRWCVEHIGNNDSTATDVVFSLGSSPVQIDIEYMLEITESGTTITGPPHTGYGSVDPDDGGSYGVILDGATNGSDPLILISGADAVVQGLRIEDHQSGATPGPPPHAIQIAADGATISSNRIVNCSGGIAVFEDVEDTLIGGSTAGAGNAIVGTTSEDGIILVEVGPGNALRHNRTSGTYGSGIFVLESAVSMGTAALVDIDDNTISLAGGDGIVVLDSRVSLEDNTVDQSTGSGVVIADFAGVTDRMLVRDNSLTANGAEGIAVLGAEVTFWGNTVEGNGGMGVVLATSLGEDTSPSGTGPDDDTLAGGVIGSSTGGDQNTIEDNQGGGLFILDATIDNIDDVETHNSFIDNGDLEVAQFWPALVQMDSMWGEPYPGVDVEIWPAGGPVEEEDPIVSGETDDDGYMVADPGFDPEDAETWPLVAGMVVFDDSGLVRFDAAPHEVVFITPETMYSTEYAWDGTDQGAGKTASCSPLTSPRCYHAFSEDMAPTASCTGEFAPCGEILELCLTNDIPCSGERREYVVCADDLGAGAPLVVGIHGGGPRATAESLFRVGGCRMLELAARDRFVAAFPRAQVIDQTPPAEYGWNDCREDRRDPGGAFNPPDLFEDVEFLRQMILKIQNDEATDTARTYIWGHSNGGTMALRAATEFDPDHPTIDYPTLTAVASNVGNEPFPTATTPDTTNECASTAESGADMMFLAGTEDDYYMPFDGGAPVNDGLRGYVRAADQTYQGEPSTVAYWATQLSISVSRDPFEFSSIPGVVDGPGAGGSSTVTVSTYGSWDGPMLKYYEVDGGGHAMPGYQPHLLNPDPPANDFCDELPVLGFGCSNADINGIDEIWRFFQLRSMYSDFGGNSPYGFTAVVDPHSIFDVDTGFDLDGNGSAGVEVTLSYGDTGVYRHEYAEAVTQSRVRFWIDPSSASLPTGNHPVAHASIACGLVPPAAGTTPTWDLNLEKRSSGFVMQLQIRDEDLFYLYEDLPLIAGPQLIEARWRTSSGGGANDGFLCANNITVSNGRAEDDVCILGVDTDAKVEDRIVFGAPVVQSGVSGTVLLDGFEAFLP